MSTAWEAIEDGGRRLVAKHGGEMSEAQAIDAFLKTTEGQALYRDYVIETDGRGSLADAQDGRDLARSAQRTQELIAGRALLRDSGYVVKNGQAGDVSNGPVADQLWQAIQKSAGEIVAKSATPLSQEQGVDRFLKTDRGRQMYAAYTEAQMAAAMAADRFTFPGVTDEQAPAPTVRKSERVQLSPDAEAFLKSFEDWMDGSGPRPWSEPGAVEKAADKSDDEQFERKLRTVLKEATQRGYRVSGLDDHHDYGL